MRKSRKNYTAEERLRWTPMFGQPKGLFKVLDFGLAARETPPRSRTAAEACLRFE